ncbi:hypothetical protein E1J61_27170 [Cupriavidus sp. L7L]|nr:hypothetical protein [Cupriavidus sp. L7L]TDF62950.1 hypothetical protein E1J61_27170 [Cupriavidus sp. L7L]
MARYLPLLARAFCVGTIIVIAAIVARQVYLRSATEAGMDGADEGRARMMLIRCETMHARLQNRHSSVDGADADRPLHIRSRES